MAKHGLKEIRRSGDGEYRICLCGLQFLGEPDDTRAALDAHVRSASRALRVVLAHPTGSDGVRDTVALGPYATTAQVLTATHQLEQAGVTEFEVVSLLSLAQWQRATQPAERAEAGR